MQRYLEFSSKHMGGEFTVRIFPSSFFSHEETAKIIQDSFYEIKRIEELLTDFADSPFNEINKYAGIKPVKVSREILDIIKESLEYSLVSRGIFDISYASVGHIWRKYLRENIEPDEDLIQKAKQYINYKLIEINEEDQTVYLPNTLMKISLGGIGKGYAVDRLFSLLRSKGLENFQVNGSGDLRVHSNKLAPRPWLIGIRNPLSLETERLMGHVEVTTGAVATSGDYKQVKNYKGEKIHHIISPSTGYSINDVVSATVFAQTALKADVYGTICLLHTAEKAVELLNEADLTGFVVHKTGQVFSSQKMNNQFNKDK